VATVDDVYYEAIKPSGLSERLLVMARDRIFRDFMTRMHPMPESRILDVGVSDVVSDGANVLERLYPHPARITACGLGEGGAFRRAYPTVHYQQIVPDTRLDFADGAFEIATANAVLEHVGSAEHQRQFVAELCRVARKVFISVPHRYFPVEHHTALPIVHFTDRSFRIACTFAGKSKWAQDENLILMTRKQLWRLAGSIDRSVAVGYTGLRLGPLSSNLFLAIH
jgi:hypothetical protein